MFERLINSRLGKPFRRSFLREISRQILIGEQIYCCHVHSWHSKLICWKYLKEVQENHNSDYLNFYVRNNSYLYCELCWFENRYDRLAFIRECINKLNKEE